MREFILMRHAETAPINSRDDDRTRNLSAHGEAEARAAGTWLAEHHAAPGCTLVSPAARTRATAAGVMAALPAGEMREDAAIYDATPGDLLRVLDASSAAQTLLVGHNPGVEQLVALLVSGQSGAFRGMPPAAIAWVRVDGELEPGAGTLHAFWSP